MRGRSILASMLVTALSAAVALPARAQAPAAAGPQVTVLLAQRIDTMDPARPRAEAMAFDATGTILALGGRDELLSKYPGAARIDAGTATVVPGLIDAHGHMTGLGGTFLTADLVDTKDKAGIIERLRRFAKVMHARGQDAGRVQVRADLWAHLLSEPELRERVATTTHRRRVLIRGWIEDGIAAGDLVDIPANALASILLALGDGLLLQGALDQRAFRWENVGRALDVLVAGIEAP